MEIYSIPDIDLANDFLESNLNQILNDCSTSEKLQALALQNHH